MVEGPDNKPPMVLVVDDEEQIRDVLAEALAQAGYGVMSAASAAEGLLALDAADPPVQLLLTDLVMPGGNGMELAAAVNRQHPDVAVLFMTGYADPALTGQVPRDALLRKPFGSDELVEAVQALLPTGPPLC